MKPFLIIIIGALALVAMNSFYILDQRQDALVLQFGKPVRTVKEPGLQFKVPFIENVEFYDNRILHMGAEPREVIAADQKRIIVDAFAKYRIVDPRKFREAVNNEAGLRSRLNSILDSSLRQVIGSKPLNALLTEQRSAIMGRIKEIVNAQVSGQAIVEVPAVENADASGTGMRHAADLGIEVVDVRIMRADLPRENSEAIYRRMQTEREREAKEIRAEGAEEAQRITSEADKQVKIVISEADQKAQVIKGQGDAEATRIFANAFGKDPDFFSFYRSMQAYAKSMDKDNTTMVLSPDSEFFKYFNRLKSE